MLNHWLSRSDVFLCRIRWFRIQVTVWYCAFLLSFSVVLSRTLTFSSPTCNYAKDLPALISSTHDCVEEYNWETESVFNKIHIGGTAKAKEYSCRPLEVEVQSRKKFSPVGTFVRKWHCDTFPYHFPSTNADTCMTIFHLPPCKNWGINKFVK